MKLPGDTCDSISTLGTATVIIVDEHNTCKRVLVNGNKYKVDVIKYPVELLTS